MKRTLILIWVISSCTLAMAGMSTGKVRKETRFLTDKMAYELNLSTPQYNDIYEINYDFIYAVRNIMDDVVRGNEWALDDYYQALDIRNDDLRWVLSDRQYRRFIGAEYFYRPIYVTGGRWNFRIYANYPNRSLFYFGIPYHYRTYSGAHYRPHIHYVSFYRGRYNHVGHYSMPYRVRDKKVYHTYRRSDFGTVRFRSNTSIRQRNAPTRPRVSGRRSSSRSKLLKQRHSSHFRSNNDNGTSSSVRSASSRNMNQRNNRSDDNKKVSTRSAERKTSVERSKRTTSRNSSSRSSERTTRTER